jgi:imidazolonepropionase-like amidohydrolase
MVPFAIDAHVHLAIAAGLGASDAGDETQVRARLSALVDEMLRGGICGALDLGAPAALLPALEMLGGPSNLVGTPTISADSALGWACAFSGPLLCAPRGYPTASWGRDGYGRAVATPEEARSAVGELHRAGARFAKLALDGRFPVLALAVARAAVLEASRLGMQSAAHALDAAAVQAALDAGVAILAHAPLEPLPEPLVREAGARKLLVLSTLHAYGNAPAARDNLVRLAAAGCRPLYGTDLGNEGTSPGLSAPELRALLSCGFTSAQILSMCTVGGAALLGDPRLGHLGAGACANLLVLDDDPLRDPTALCRPRLRIVAGRPLEENGLETR